MPKRRIPTSIPHPQRGFQMVAGGKRSVTTGPSNPKNPRPEGPPDQNPNRVILTAIPRSPLINLLPS
jgi:hypothetical protein